MDILKQAEIVNNQVFNASLPTDFESVNNDKIYQCHNVSYISLFSLAKYICMHTETKLFNH